MRILVAGATGYVGGRLVPRLLERRHSVRVLVRDPNRLAGRDWSGKVEVQQADLLDPDSLAGVLDGIDTAYYLVHSMGGPDDFARTDRKAAGNFLAAGKRSDSLKHAIYLGGLQPADEGKASGHLASRAEVGRILRDGLPTTEFRAGPIIGSGSASFEMVRYLTERLPIMVAPKWVNNDVQPIAVRDILAYLAAAAELGEDQAPAGVVPVGANRLSFRAMMQGYAQARGLMRRRIIPVPVLAPRLAARWVGFVTPITNKVAIPLVEGVVQPLVIEGDRAGELFPGVQPIPYEEAVGLALAKIERGEVETRWTGALGREGTLATEDWEGMNREVRTVATEAEASAVFDVFASLGGDRGYLAWDWAWWLRGLLDQLIGGPGVRRGRRDPRHLLPGEAMDWWRVEAVDRPRLLRLRAEMKVPGTAWLQWETKPAADCGEAAKDTPGAKTCLVQTAVFEPKGLPGALYWYALLPIHLLIFTGMAKAIVREAERGSHEDADAARGPVG